MRHVQQQAQGSHRPNARRQQASGTGRSQQSAGACFQQTPNGRSRATQPAAQAGGPRKTALLAGVVVAVLAVVYCLGCAFFYQRFFPNTTIGSANVSLMTAGDARQALANTSSSHVLTVSGQGVEFTVDAGSAGLEIDAAAAVDAALAQTSSWQWPVQLFVRHDASDALTGSFDTTVLRPIVERSLAAYNGYAAGPTDAYLYYDPAMQRFQVNPGTMGGTYDVDSVMRSIMDAMARHESHVALTSANLVQQSVKADDERLLAAQEAANAHLGCSMDFTVYGNVVATVGPDVVQDWVVVGSDLSVWLDDAKLVAWVDTVEAIVDTVGDTRTYVRSDGKVVTVTGGTYGWISDGYLMDQMTRDAVYNGIVGSQEVPFYQYADSFNPGGQDWGYRYVDIDLTEQYARFYDYDGSIVRETPIISGETSVPGRATPEGVYSITGKALNQTLIGLDDPETGEPLYETPVTYWMPFIENMVGLHDASWQSSFGGNLYQMGFGSHGCINLPPAVASWAYSWINIGDVVITHY